MSPYLQQVQKYHSPLGDVLLSLLLYPLPPNYSTSDGGEIELTRVVHIQWLGTGTRGKSSLSIPFCVLIRLFMIYMKRSTGISLHNYLINHFE